MDAPSPDDIWILVEYTRGESLMERRCLNLVVNRELSLFTSWNGERFNVPACGLLPVTSHLCGISESYCSRTF